MRDKNPRQQNFALAKSYFNFVHTVTYFVNFLI